ncbi:adenine nucleotide alpha hydrolases-like protein [Xylariaceae sp. FL1651]|nr:adenine nucleotide alpha hydrolases-like protein [Xylariaceae sp. FL1651]
MVVKGESLSVIALISGGKDSFYSILHCLANGHSVVALANLYPSGVSEGFTAAQKQESESGHVGSVVSVPQQHGSSSSLGTDNSHARNESETDLNSFMYQTVGHQIIPLYAQVTGLPLYRQPIVGTAVHHGLSYQNPRHGQQSLAAPSSLVLRPSTDYPSLAAGNLQGCDELQAAEKEHEPEDETESLVPLLRVILETHPEANALCTGAILSTYQRTRVESVALRLGLVPLSYLWQFTELPMSLSGSYHDQGTTSTETATSSSHDNRRRARRTRRERNSRDDAQLLRDMAAIGLEARIIKVASAGLDEGFLWENMASEAGVQRAERAMRRFGAAGGRGSILGEGGEFETLVLDGPPSLFRGRIVVSDENRRVVHEGGGCAWLSFHDADVEMKEEPERASGVPTPEPGVRVPGLFDPRFEDTIRCLLVRAAGDKQDYGFVKPSSSDDNTNLTTNFGSTSNSHSLTVPDLPRCQLPLSPPSSEWSFLGGCGAGPSAVEDQTVSIVDQIARQLGEHALPATAITNSIIVLRRMSDFPLVNERYGLLFREPNPPSRVTISCGDELLPEGTAIAVYLTVQLHLQPHERRALHVQSRSYWAPANIGPYSQAIAFPLLSPSIAETEARDDDVDELRPHSDASSSPLAVSIAGQIPLLPASMALPSPSTPDHTELQLTLALQHLWRVGAEMRVRWWTSAVAYFPATPSTKTMRHQALLAATAWKAAHIWPDMNEGYDSKSNDGHEVSDDDEVGPDIWDRTYNAQFITYGGGDGEESFPLPLPDWDVLKGFDADADAEVVANNRIAHVPCVFAAEVEELPRQAGVEWHAHLGLAELQARSVTLLCCPNCAKIAPPQTTLFDLDLHHVAVESEQQVFIQTAAALRPPANSEETQRTPISTDILNSVFIATAKSLERQFSLPSLRNRPKITYTDSLQIPDSDSLKGIGTLIPCRSLWDSQGRRLSAVCVFETRVAKVK